MRKSGSRYFRHRRLALPETAGEWGAILTAALSVGAFVVLLVPALTVPRPIVVITATFAGAALLAVVSWTMLSPLIALIRRGPAPVAATAGATAITLTGMMLVYSRPIPAVVAAVVTVTPISILIGSALGQLVGVFFRPASARARITAVLWAALAVTAVWWLSLAALAPGNNEHLPEQYRGAAPAPESKFSASGPYDVRTLSYGSGTDYRRARYRADADILTPTVDLSGLLPRLNTLRRRYRDAHWGFTLQEAPLNGMVWYPDGEGPFPLFVIAHGNHAMERSSEPGYAYLGVLLASRGYIVASIDHNYLNMSALGGDWRGDEIGARAILTLEHLELWSAWNETPENRFYGRVDLDRIALGGHSRGGEAAAAAAMLNRMTRFPEHAARRISGGHNIRSVIAISPSDGLYRPGGESIRLSDTDYLVLHGGHDGDAFVFIGLGQYYRTEFSNRGAGDSKIGGAGERFKAAVYLYRANHGQFNSRWKRTDLSFPLGYLLNTAPVMQDSEQQQHAARYISAFLEAGLREERAARKVFREPNAAMQRDSNREEAPQQTELLRPTPQHARILYADTLLQSPLYTTDAAGITVWRKRRHHSRTRFVEFPIQVTELAWEAAAPAHSSPPAQAEAGKTASGAAEAPAYHLYPAEVPAGASALVFPIADLRQHTRTQHGLPLLELEIEIETRPEHGGAQLHRRPLALTPPLPVQFTKLGALERALLQPSEPLLLPHFIRLVEFSPGPIDPTSIRRVTLRFDPRHSGRLHLGALQFS